jgi:hypothetical protein
MGDEKEDDDDYRAGAASFTRRWCPCAARWPDFGGGCDGAGAAEKEHDGVCRGMLRRQSLGLGSTWQSPKPDKQFISNNVIGRAKNKVHMIRLLESCTLNCPVRGI